MVAEYKEPRAINVGLAKFKEQYVRIATEQKLIDLESFKKWAIDNSYIPFDYYNDVKGVEEERVVSFHYLMDYLKSIEE